VDILTGRYNHEPDLGAIVSTIEALEVPVVAALHGRSLGAAVELALGAHWRIGARDSQIGFPEVMSYGVIPTDGGSQRLPRLVGIESAVDLLSSGRLLTAEEALELGLLDELLPALGTWKWSASSSRPDATAQQRSSVEWLSAAESFAETAAARAKAEPGSLATRRVSKRPTWSSLGDSQGQEAKEATHSAFFQEAFSRARKLGRGRTAPVAAVAAVQASQEADMAQGLATEARLAAAQLTGGEARALFYADRAEAKATTRATEAAVAPTDVNADVDANEGQQSTTSGGSVGIPPDTPSSWPRVVGVVGGGTMGRGIAMAFLDSPQVARVYVLESSPDLADRVMTAVRDSYLGSSAFRTGRLTLEALEAKLARLVAGCDYELFSAACEDGGCDLVVEAVYEDLATKQKVFEQLAKHCRPDATLATNTSALDVDAICSAVGPQGRIDRTVGTHFFSPANVMRLLEVVRGAQTSEATVKRALALATPLRKISVLSENCFGFIGNRMLAPYAEEGHFLLEEGCNPAQIDAVLKREVGLSMGLFEMLDLAGNDVGWRQRIDRGLAMVPTEEEVEVVELKGSRPLVGRYCSLADRLCEAGFYGQKAGQGWYRYDPTSPRQPLVSAESQALIEEHRGLSGHWTRRDISDEEILERCMFPLVNEAFKILEEGICGSAEEVDLVYLHGYGFPRHKVPSFFIAFRCCSLPFTSL
jgi:3-hydroxyacyl-CoA dehydrogenase/enoyl-CoA hydratase/carnithine racemase